MKILKVLSVVDTREYEEEGDHFVPVPGSGQLHACGRCGREHAIHWTVLLEGGETTVVGGSCARSDSLNRSAVASAERYASRKKRLEKELSHETSKLSELERVISEVNQLEKPPFTTGKRECSDGSLIDTVRMGDGGDVWCQFTNTDDPERRRIATFSWIGKRIAERTKIKDSVFILKDRIKTLKKDLSAVEGKLRDMAATMTVA